MLKSMRARIALVVAFLVSLQNWAMAQFPFSVSSGTGYQLDKGPTILDGARFVLSFNATTTSESIQIAFTTEDTTIFYEMSLCSASSSSISRSLGGSAFVSTATAGGACSGNKLYWIYVNGGNFAVGRGQKPSADLFKTLLTTSKDNFASTAALIDDSLLVKGYDSTFSAIKKVQYGAKVGAVTYNSAAFGSFNDYLTYNAYPSSLSIVALTDTILPLSAVGITVGVKDLNFNVSAASFAWANITITPDSKTLVYTLANKATVTSKAVTSFTFSDVFNGLVSIKYPKAVTQAGVSVVSYLIVFPNTLTSTVKAEVAVDPGFWTLMNIIIVSCAGGGGVIIFGAASIIIIFKKKTDDSNALRRAAKFQNPQIFGGPPGFGHNPAGSMGGQRGFGPQSPIQGQGPSMGRFGTAGGYQQHGQGGTNGRTPTMDPKIISNYQQQQQQKKGYWPYPLEDDEADSDVKGFAGFAMPVNDLKAKWQQGHDDGTGHRNRPEIPIKDPRNHFEVGDPHSPSGRPPIDQQFQAAADRRAQKPISHADMIIRAGQMGGDEIMVQQMDADRRARHEERARNEDRERAHREEKERLARQDLLPSAYTPDRNERPGPSRRIDMNSVFVGGSRVEDLDSNVLLGWVAKAGLSGQLKDLMANVEKLMVELIRVNDLKPDHAGRFDIQEKHLQRTGLVKASREEMREPAPQMVREVEQETPALRVAEVKVLEEVQKPRREPPPPPPVPEKSVLAAAPHPSAVIEETKEKQGPILSVENLASPSTSNDVEVPINNEIPVKRMSLSPSPNQPKDKSDSLSIKSARSSCQSSRVAESLARRAPAYVTNEMGDKSILAYLESLVQDPTNEAPQRKLVMVPEDATNPSADNLDDIQKQFEPADSIAAPIDQVSLKSADSQGSIAPAPHAPKLVQTGKLPNDAAAETVSTPHTIGANILQEPPMVPMIPVRMSLNTECEIVAPSSERSDRRESTKTVGDYLPFVPEIAAEGRLSPPSIPRSVPAKDPANQGSTEFIPAPQVSSVDSVAMVITPLHAAVPESMSQVKAESTESIGAKDADTNKTEDEDGVDLVASKPKATGKQESQQFERAEAPENTALKSARGSMASIATVQQQNGAPLAETPLLKPPTPMEPEILEQEDRIVPPVVEDLDATPPPSIRKAESAAAASNPGALAEEPMAADSKGEAEISEEAETRDSTASPPPPPPFPPPGVALPQRAAHPATEALPGRPGPPSPSGRGGPPPPPPGAGRGVPGPPPGLGRGGPRPPPGAGRGVTGPPPGAGRGVPSPPPGAGRGMPRPPPGAGRGVPSPPPEAKEGKSGPPPGAGRGAPGPPSPSGRGGPPPPPPGAGRGGSGPPPGAGRGGPRPPPGAPTQAPPPAGRGGSPPPVAVQKGVPPPPTGASAKPRGPPPPPPPPPPAN